MELSRDRFEQRRELSRLDECSFEHRVDIEPIEGMVALDLGQRLGVKVVVKEVDFALARDETATLARD